MDWLIAYDDLFTARHAHCLLCSRLCLDQAWHGIWDLAPDRSVAYVLCVRCRSQEGGRAQVRALLVQRYKEI